MNCRVVVEAAVPVYDVETPDEAIRIAISKTGEMLNPDLNYVEIDMGTRTSPSGEELPPAFIAADEALVALELEMTVFNVEREEHASRIARKEIGQRLQNIPLEVVEVEVIDEAEEGDDTGTETEQGDDTETETEEGDDTETETEEGDDTGTETEEGDDTASEGKQPLEETLSDDIDIDAEGEEGNGSGRADAGDEEVLPEFEELIDE